MVAHSSQTGAGLKKVLVANRGEIAVRVIQACKELGIHVIAIYSEADSSALHVVLADEAHCIGPAPATASYLNSERIIQVALETGATAIHPGYGFLSENAEFARACRSAGVTFIGPGPEAMEAMGGKIPARLRAERAGIPVVPGESAAIESLEQAAIIAERVSYPIAIKASAGGGGRGLRVVYAPQELEVALDSARREGLAFFKDATVFIERYIAEPRHVEVQILADHHGNALSLGQRDCSVQRNHQKLIEEAPALIADTMARAMDAASLQLVREIGYVGAGTLEFLVDGSQFYFLEMNTRIQVEHTVTEMVTGLDLVQAQLRIAAGERLWFSQSDVQTRGHSIECRINAEDPAQNFRAAPGRITAFRPPSGAGVRLDSSCYPGYAIPPHYDSMVAKLVVWGDDRESARRRMIRALDEFVLQGPPTTIPFHLLALQHPDFVGGRATTGFVSRLDLSHLATASRVLPTTPVEPNEDPPLPVASSGGRRFQVQVDGQPFTVEVAEVAVDRRGTRERRSTRGKVATGGGTVKSPMHGVVVRVPVHTGQQVVKGAVLCVIEAMKMENEVLAPDAGTVAQVLVQAGETVDGGAPLIRMESDDG